MLYLPRAMFDATGKVTLDDVSLTEIESSLGVQAATAGCMEGILSFLTSATSLAKGAVWCYNRVSRLKGGACM